MLKILCGIQRPTEGTVSVPNDATIGYLPQVMKLSDDTTVAEETPRLLEPHPDEGAPRQHAARDAERTDYESDDYLALVERFTQEHDRYMMMGGENYEAEMSARSPDWGSRATTSHVPPASSRGPGACVSSWRRSFFDIPMCCCSTSPPTTSTLSRYNGWTVLAQSAKAVVLVSHDRAFINNVTNRTIELTCGHAETTAWPTTSMWCCGRSGASSSSGPMRTSRRRLPRRRPSSSVPLSGHQGRAGAAAHQAAREDCVGGGRRRVQQGDALKFPPCLRSGDYPVICDEVRKDYGEHPSSTM